ncbi:hypothetical protein HHK36_026128 [Tetracentron sinense]|uniref:Disease resistance protein At1g50180 n=1 Tax=Tetracentron sinense TaxID=13715 RepID=A0A835D3P3_TETSI|nr:hypothetical protein HHK36_026128 [Tetracentron sinense]
MADPGALLSIAERFGYMLYHESVYLNQVQEQIQQLQNELNQMQCFLKDADAKREEDESARKWIADIRDTAYEAEDVVDTFILKVASRRKWRVIQRYACFIREWREIHKIGSEIQVIQTRICNFSKSRETYGIRNIGEIGEGTSFANERRRQLRHSYPHADEVHVNIGLQRDADALVKQLKDDEGFRVVSIVGMGGLGKTTLAKKVYNHSHVKCYFECCAWVFISQQCRARDVLQAILIKISSFAREEREMINAEDERIPQQFRGRGVVQALLTKVSSFRRDEREMIKAKEEREIIIAKEEREMIKAMTEEELVEKLYAILEKKRYLVVLDDIWSKEAWDMLKPAFPIGRKGSKLLLTTRNKEVVLHADPRSIIHEPRLLTKEESLELLCKKAFPVGKMGSAGRAKTCRLHDLMRDLCISKGREENFLEIFLRRGNMDVGDSSSSAAIAASKPRARAIHFGHNHVEHENEHLRSLLLFEEPKDSKLKSACKKFKLLRVLHLDDVTVKMSLPKEIGDLIHLRYLRLSGVVNIPTSVRNLRSLQILCLKGHLVLPNVIGEMKQLRHLILSRQATIKPDLRLDTLINLRTLKNIYSGNWIKRDLSNLKNLRKLKIIGILELEWTEDIESTVLELDCLRSLSLEFQGQIPRLAPFSRCDHLSKLRLTGKIEGHPHLHQVLPPNLKKLTLKGSELYQDPFLSLEKLPNLRILRLQNDSYIGRDMVCTVNGFPQLESLQLQSLRHLEEMRLGVDAMPSLRRLEILFCPYLNMLPEGLKFVTTLQELEITTMPQNFTCRLREGGEDWDKVKQIPTITFN